jgi:hypothetical protein
MAPFGKPGPLCTQSPVFWPFDHGTLCLQQSQIPGPVDPHIQKKANGAKMIAEDAPSTGIAWPSLSVGAPSVMRIPVKGMPGLAIELKARGYLPSMTTGKPRIPISPGNNGNWGIDRGIDGMEAINTGSTSIVFIQDITGKRVLRLDYGLNVKTGNVNWHWNHQGVYKDFKIVDHTVATPAAEMLGRTAKYFRYGGKLLVVYAAADDFLSIVTSSRPLRRTVQVVAAWKLSAMGCTALGAELAALGTGPAPGLGTIIGGAVGCVVGGFIGYKTGEATTGYLYDWAEDNLFTPLPPDPEMYPPDDPGKSLPSPPREYELQEL